MRRLGLLVIGIVACSDRIQSPPRAPVASTAPLPAAAAARHAGPSCPLPPLAPVPGATESGEDPEFERIAKAPRGDTCATADSNLQRVEKAILAPANPVAAAKSRPWDHKRTPEFARLVERRLAMSPAEHKRLTDQGMVVLARYSFENYSKAFHEVYQSQLPLFVSIDSVLHAIYAGNDSLIADLEDHKLRDVLADVLDRLSCTLPAVAGDYPADTARDLDLYLAVAQALVRGSEPASMFGDRTVDAEATALIKQIADASEMDTERGVELFGRRRVIDFTAYTPRGHYSATEDRQRYFRAGMWLSRIEFNLVSRSSRSSQPGTAPDPSETPREELDALALADLVDRTRLTKQVAMLDTAWALLAGRREDVSVAELSTLRRAAKIDKLTDPDAATKLRAAIGDQFQRIARLHYMPAGSTQLPAIATLLGPRVVPDADATRPLVDGEVPGRTRLTAADMAYVLGHDRAKTYLASELAKFPTLGAQLDVARDRISHGPSSDSDLYSAWLSAVVMLGERRSGTWPSFTTTPAYADFRIDTALTAFGHIKHNYVLIAGESYFEGGCVIPDGYVEPAPSTYAMLLNYAERGEMAMAALDADGSLGGARYFTQLATVLTVLMEIQDTELADRPLSANQRAFLSMVAEMEPGTTGGPPTYTGWWFDMFRHREVDGLAPPDYIASYFTGEAIAYIGATAPRLGVFVVDTGGPPRLMVGPVARGYEYEGPVAHRLDNAEARALAEADRKAPWAASYTAPAPPAPRLYLHWWRGDDEKAVIIDTDVAVGPVTIELYDHHRVALTSTTRDVKPGKTLYPVTRTSGVEGVHIHAGGYDGWFDLGLVEMGVSEKLGGYDKDDDAP
ncbi:MAG TPA: DUF3160 domain-containing protein [Kofleriaceae bacterium]|jgi:hypothetical protein|nr:DUF3160 domain-containing protein [Kofleriaceae bacterium]